MSETRKLAAILVADVVGYSRLAGADEDRTLARLRGLRSDVIDPAIAAHHGRIVKRTGDGSIIEFRSVVDAVRCAIEVQSGMVERNAGLPPDRRIEFRVGIHVGDVVEESDGDLMGDGVNIAARLEGIAATGRDLSFGGRLSTGQGSPRSHGQRSRRNPTQEHLPSQCGSIRCKSASRRRRSPPSPQGRVAKKRLALLPLTAGIAALLILISGSAWYVLHRQPTRVRCLERASAARGPTSFHRGVAVRQSQRRSGAGLPRRRAHR